MRIVSTIEARMTSSRLPGKVLLPALGKSMLEHLVNRLRTIELIDEIVLATTINAADDPLIAEAEKVGISYFRGSEDDVMQRVIDTAASADADIVVEITGDCPIIDPKIVKQSIEIFLENKVDYVSNVIVRSYPDGMDTQVFSLETLKRSAGMTEDKLDHEHVSLHIRNNPELFSQIHLRAPQNIHWPELGLTLDEMTDYKLIKKVIEHFGISNPYFSCEDVVDLLRQKSDWVAINEKVERKGNT